MTPPTPPAPDSRLRAFNLAIDGDNDQRAAWMLDHEDELRALLMRASVSSAPTLTCEHCKKDCTLSSLCDSCYEALPPAAPASPSAKLCDRMVPTGTGSTVCTRETGHGGPCSFQAGPAAPASAPLDLEGIEAEAAGRLWPPTWEMVDALIVRVKQLSRASAPDAPTAERKFPIQAECGAKPHLQLIPWSVAEKAYSVYSAQYGNEQSLQQLAGRGGFHPSEMDAFHPAWREESDEIFSLKAQLVVLTAGRAAPASTEEQ